VIQRFQAYGWHTLHVTDANDLHALSTALEPSSAIPVRRP